jgi:hypothetical protein
MLLNKQIQNIFYTHKRTISNNGYNILYRPHETFFDAAMNHIDSNILTTICVEDIKNDFYKHILYSGILINDIVEYSQNIYNYAEFYTRPILLIHSSPLSIFKKEDINILKTRLNAYAFLSFDQQKESWPMSDISYINYGIPNIKDIDINNNKKKNILIINTKKQKHSHILYQYIKNTYPDADMIESAPNDIEHICKLLSTYKVCIDIDNYYNVLLANSCGAYGITASQTFDKDIIKVNNYEDIIGMLPQLLSENMKEANNIRENVIKKYDWDTFGVNIQNHIKNIITKDFIV